MVHSTIIHANKMICSSTCASNLASPPTSSSTNQSGLAWQPSNPKNVFCSKHGDIHAIFEKANKYWLPGMAEVRKDGIASGI